MSRLYISAALVALLFASPAAAQNGSGDSVPAGHRPPPGMCRIWIDDVPAGQQSAPTDCATAIRNRPANGRVVFGDEYSSNTKKKKLIPSGLFGGKKEVPVKKLRDGDSPTVEAPAKDTPRAKADSGDRKPNSKKAKKAKKDTDKSVI